MARTADCAENEEPLAADKSPKSAEFPRVEIVKKSSEVVMLGVPPPPIIPLVLLLTAAKD